MYQAFFGLSERPFQLTPNPRFLFLNPRYREALATLRYGLSSSLGITLLLGEAGTGKTTLLRAALEAERSPEHRHVVLSNPTLTPADFYEILSEAFSLPHISGSKGRFLMAFERDLLERHTAGGLTALVVDEAQSLTHELFEELRLLANLETPTAKLLSVVLVGQQELADRVSVTRQTIIALESGKYGPSLSLAFRIARVFGVTVEGVFQYDGGADSINPHSPSLAEAQ